MVEHNNIANILSYSVNMDRLSWIVFNTYSEAVEFLQLSFC